MSKKPVSQKRALRQQQERAALNNIFNVFLLGLAAECYLFIVYRGYVGGTIQSLLTWHKILQVIAWAGLALTVGGGAAAFLKRKEPKILKIASSAAFAGLFLAVSGWIMVRFTDVGVVAMCIIVPVLTILGLIFFLYQHECFLSTLLLAGSLFTVWVCGRALDSHWATMITICSGAVVVGLVLVALAVAKLKKNGGKLGVIQIFSPDCDYRLIYVVCAVCAALIIATVLMPTLSFYVTWVLVVVLFAELAYYTTKMM